MLKNKKILIAGLANKHSIAAGIAQAMHAQGAELAFTYQSERLRGNVEKIAAELGSNLLFECDVASDESIENLYQELSKKWKSFDGFVHSIGFAPSNELEGNFIDVATREGFQIAHDISSYSFTAMAKGAKPMLNENAALLTLTYLGSMQSLPNYNVMGLAKASLEANTRFLAAAMGPDGIRVNAISAGPIKTLAASGIGDFRFILKWNELNSPLKRNVTLEDVGNTGAYLLSDLSSGVTGEVHHVDCGYHTVGMVAVDEAEGVANLLNDFKNK